MSLQEWNRAYKQSIGMDQPNQFFGLDRSGEATRFTRPYVDTRKWYQKINWLQMLARKILVDY